MNYEQAKIKVKENITLIGEPMYDSIIKFLIVSPKEELKEVLNEWASNGFDNESALITLGLIDREDLLVFKIPDLQKGFGIYSEIE